MKISFVLNGKKKTIEADAEERLIDILRNKFDATGVKEACGEGECGSCSVMINGKLVLACLTPMVRVEGCEITTIEGLGGKETDYVQRAFVDADAIQCGFCTPGLILSVYDYVETGGKNDREEIKKTISGNLCRCTGYTKVIDAVVLAIKYKNENRSIK